MRSIVHSRFYAGKRAENGRPVKFDPELGYVGSSAHQLHGKGLVRRGLRWRLPGVFRRSWHSFLFSRAAAAARSHLVGWDGDVEPLDGLPERRRPVGPARRLWGPDLQRVAERGGSAASGAAPSQRLVRCTQRALPTGRSFAGPCGRRPCSFDFLLELSMSN